MTGGVAANRHAGGKTFRGQAARFAASRTSKRSRASSTRLPCASDHEPSAFSGGAIVAPSGDSAYSTRGGTSAWTRRDDQPVALHRAQRLRQHLLRDRREILQQLVIAAGAVTEREQNVDRPLRAQQRDRVADQPSRACALRDPARVGTGSG